MLGAQAIDRIVGKVAKQHLGSGRVVKVYHALATDSTANEAVRITIVIRPDAVKHLKGDAVLDTLVHIQEQLNKAGDERVPIVEYATEEELKESGDPQS
jgi:hypothetical protein